MSARYDRPRHREVGDRIIARVKGYLDSNKYQLIQYNAPRTSLPACLKITPGKKSPSLLPLERSDWIALQAMVIKKQVPEIIEQLEASGAEDILVFTLTTCRV